MKANYSLILCAAALISACASHDVKVGMDDAKDAFKKRQIGSAIENEIAQANADAALAVRPRRKLVQFRYSPTSFENLEFQNYLKRLSTSPSYVSDLALARPLVPLTAIEIDQILQERKSKRRQLVVNEMRKMQFQLTAFGANNHELRQGAYLDLTFRGASIGSVVKKIQEQSGSRFEISEGIRSSKLRVSGNYKGDTLTILQSLMTQYGIGVRISKEEHQVWIVDSKEAVSQAFKSPGYINPFTHQVRDEEGVQTLHHYQEALQYLSNGDTERFMLFFNRTLPPTLGPVSVAYDELSRGVSALNQILKKFDAETQNVKKGVMPSTSFVEGEISQDVLVRGLLDKNLCPGQEVITEKLIVYQESPKEVVKFLEGYFKVNSVSEPDISTTISKNLEAKENSVDTSLPIGYQPYSSKAVKTIDQSAQGQGSNVTASSNSQTTKNKSHTLVANTPKVSSQPMTYSERCEKGDLSAEFKVLEDPTGVIVTGSLQQIELAVRLTSDVDIPTKQVMAEVFLVEVQKNWARTIETRFARTNTNNTSSVGGVAQIIDAATMLTSKNTSGMQGKFSANGGDINAFINLLESNSVGRSISSPTLIAKNGEEAEIAKTITLRKSVQSVITSAHTGVVSQPALPLQQIQKLEVPLILKIKPTINQHNKHVTLKFDYAETTLNSEAADTPIEKGTTKNSITTTLETAPGEVVVLAGLFKEANTKNTSSLPGLSGIGPWATLFGGSDATSTQSTELLVFIKPTVIEPRANLSQLNVLK
jgi:type II secretory pathway component GspD/PulD (secretin)